MISEMIHTNTRRLAAALVTPLLPEGVVSLLVPRRFHRAIGEIDSIEPVGVDAATLRIKPSRGWTAHLPGQFVSLAVDVDGVRHHRCFSLTSLPDAPDGRIEITVQAKQGGTVSTHLVHHARAGDLVGLAPAAGYFTLGAEDSRLLFITGGSGITPVVGMLRWLVASGRTCDVVLLHHARDARRMLFADELARLGDAPWFRCEIVHTAASDGLGGGANHLDGHRLATACPDWAERETFACGPPPLLDVVTRHWAETAAAEHLHLERFTNESAATPPLSALGSPAIARFTASDVWLATDASTPLLDVAEACGATPPSGCRMGICHTCTTPLLSGSVRDVRNGNVSTAGAHVQLCVSTPIGDVTLDA